MLVVDDDPAVRDLMLPRPWPPRASDDHRRRRRRGPAALRRETQPDLIFLDVLMPKMDGWAVLTTLKADPDVADIPVVMLTRDPRKRDGLHAGGGRVPDQADRPRPPCVGAGKVHAAAARNEVLIVEDDPPPGKCWPVAQQAGLARRPRPRTAASRLSDKRRAAAGADPARPDDAGDGRVRVPRRDAASNRTGTAFRSSC